ncbi:MAG: ABC transporter permease, partial [Acidimicrobiales bacterium]
MKQLIRSELLKLRTTRATFWMLVGLPASVAIAVAASIASANRAHGGLSLHTVEGVRNVLSAASSGNLLVLILGIVAMTGEYQHQTATQTFLATPVRTRVVAAKLYAYALVGLVVAMAAAALTLAIALPWLASEGVRPRAVEDVGLVLVGATAVTVLYGALGVAVGALFRNQTAAIVLSVGWVLLFETIFVGFLPSLGRWFPGGAATALSSTTVHAGDLLPM